MYACVLWHESQFVEFVLNHSGCFHLQSPCSIWKFPQCILIGRDHRSPGDNQMTINFNFGIFHNDRAAHYLTRPVTNKFNFGLFPLVFGFHFDCSIYASFRIAPFSVEANKENQKSATGRKRPKGPTIFQFI